MGLFKSFTVAASFLSLGSASVVRRSFNVPSSNGFPNPDAAQQKVIGAQAGGLLPNSPLPSSLDAGSTTAFQLIAFNELFETSYFSSLLHNITERLPGYEAADHRVATAIKAVLAQEELHAIGAIATLQNAGKFAPSACKYQFPTASLVDSIFFAETFTAAVLGALQGANVLFSQGGLSPVVQLISSIIGQEGEQNGYYRYFLNRIPSEKPFLTYVPAPFAFSVLQAVVVPGSCPYPLSNINLPIFPLLFPNGRPVPIDLLKPEDQIIKFTGDLSQAPNGKKYIGKPCDGLYLTYTAGQQLPISVSIFNVKWKGSQITFEAQFPYTANVLAGFTHAALTTTNKFDTQDAVAGSTLVGPALLQVNNPI
ncbi:late sexual development protein [Stachybotrys elegans]|uniref:Late sexual development protein n=1 Tax=Stachybotrys elegans TaxID=80388 RepID=A0A8K0SCN5_9HYPO|nr:late sexual development protein [Stachybotrys elegans]KAH7325647.1 late sexual development protein [Stachybotrys elegans]